MPDFYITLDGSRVVGASARLQGAENIRADEAERLAFDYCDEHHLTDQPSFHREQRLAYDRMTIVNTELQDI